MADVVVVHKADLAGAERMEAQVRELLSLPGCRDIPVLRVSSREQQGLAELWAAVASAPRRDRGKRERRRNAVAPRTADAGRTVSRSRQPTRRAGDRPLARHELDEAQAADEAACSC